MARCMLATGCALHELCVLSWQVTTVCAELCVLSCELQLCVHMLRAGNEVYCPNTILFTGAPQGQRLLRRPPPPPTPLVAPTALSHPPRISPNPSSSSSSSSYPRSSHRQGQRHLVQRPTPATTGGCCSASSDWTASSASRTCRPAWPAAAPSSRCGLLGCGCVTLCVGVWVVVCVCE